MERIHTLIAKYKSNYEEWDELNRALMENMTKEKWSKKLKYVTKRKHEIYHENNTIIKEIEDKIASGINEELADEIYQGALSLYWEDNHDTQMVLEFVKAVIPYYEEKNDIEKCTMLYAAAQYEIIDTYNLEYRNETIDFSYNEKARRMLKDYETLSDKLRYRVLYAYYYYLIVAMDVGCISVKESFDNYYELERVLSKSNVSITENFRDKCEGLIRRIREGMLLAIIKSHRMSQEEKDLLYQYAKNYFKKYKTTRKSDYELNSVEYACYLYIDQYEENKSDIELFDRYLDFFEYSYLQFEKEPIINADMVADHINAVECITLWSDKINDPKRLQRVVNNIMVFAEARWIKGNISVLSQLNHMLCKVCTSILSIKSVIYNREESILQLVIQRNLEAYLRGIIVSDIAREFYDEIISNHKKYFDEITAVPKEQLREFIHYGAMFHHVGQTPVLGVVVTNHRMLNEEEELRKKKHTQYGVEAFLKIPDLSKYADIIRGHHKYYDGSMGEPEEYDNTKSEIRAIVDIIALSVAIEEATDIYSEVERKVYTIKEYMEVIRKEKNHRFSGKLVEILEESSWLQTRLNEIVTIGRLDRMYDVYHNWEKIQLAQDEASVMLELKRHVNEYTRSRDDKTFEPYFEQLKKLAEIAGNEQIRCEALYYLCLCYQLKGDIKNAKLIDSELERVFECTTNYELQVKHNFSMGSVEIKDEAYEAAIGRYLIAATIATKIPECKMVQMKAYANIASIYVNMHYYERALYYYEKAEQLCEENCDFEISLLCGKGYCSIFTGDLETVKDYRDRINNNPKKWPERHSFAVCIYLASFDEALGDTESLEQKLEKLREACRKEIDLTLYTTEIFIYFQLLERLRKYQELSQLLDYYIDLCNRKGTLYHIYSRLILFRIRCSSVLGDMDTFSQYAELFYDAMKFERLKRARQIETTEEFLINSVSRMEEQRQIQKDKKLLEQSVLDAMNANKQKSEFLSSMSHEIRTPINAIIGLNEMVLRESTEEPILQYANDIRTASKQLLGIVNDVLDFSKIEAGKMNIMISQYDVKSFLNDIKNMFDTKSMKNLKFNVVCDEEIPCVLSGDELRNKQIILNLLSNAFKYTKEGSITLAVSYEKVDEKSILLRVSVKDTGIGLKKEEIERLAVPFERFDDVRNRKIEGTGLGISIVTQLLELMGSKLEVESVYGEGSTFSFAIKQEVVNWMGIGVFEEQKEQSRKEKREAKFKAPKVEILIVDDNSINLKVTKALLKRTHAQVTLAENGLECLQLCKEKGFHVILLDHMMPELDGVETLQRLRTEEGPNQNTVVIALTANAVPNAKEYYQSYGFDDVVMKPINPSELERKLMSYIPEYLRE